MRINSIPKSNVMANFGAKGKKRYRGKNEKEKVENCIKNRGNNRLKTRFSSGYKLTVLLSLSARLCTVFLDVQFVCLLFDLFKAFE